MSIGKRIRQRRKELKLTQKQVSDAIRGVSNVAISQWESDITKPNSENLVELANVLQCDFLWLLKGEGFEPSAKFVRVLKSFQYPLLSTIQAGKFTEVTHFDHIDGVEMISSQVKASERAFYLAISGDSMTPRFNDGDMVLIDPEIAPTPGKFVAAINPDGEATFKQYKQLGTLDEHGRPHFNLVPLNDSHATLSSKDHAIQIIGVAVEHRQVL